MSRGGTGFRARERGLLGWAARTFGASETGGLGAVRLGRALVLFAGILVTAAAPFLGPDARGWFTLLFVTPTMGLLCAGTVVLDWSRTSPQATLVFPALVMLGLSTTATQAPTLVAPLTGLLSLCFVYIGITQPVGTSVLAVVPAAGTFTLINEGWSRPVVVRLVLSVIIWVLLAELLAYYNTRQRALTAALQAAAHTDALTGVPNRRDLDLRLALAQPGDALVVCDLDRFKQVNDERGHARGDRILADFGGMLRLALREGDYCARYGGEEFVVVLPQSSVEAADAFVSRLHSLWAALQPQVTFSAGIARCRAGQPTDVTLAAADTALYAAKDAGRNTHRVAPADYAGAAPR
jgi:diguanylate cyclase (GGDEF)-like protein